MHNIEVTIFNLFQSGPVPEKTQLYDLFNMCIFIKSTLEDIVQLGNQLVSMGVHFETYQTSSGPKHF